jgi:hypothetical protein
MIRGWIARSPAMLGPILVRFLSGQAENLQKNTCLNFKIQDIWFIVLLLAVLNILTVKFKIYGVIIIMVSDIVTFKFQTQYMFFEWGLMLPFVCYFVSFMKSENQISDLFIISLSNLLSASKPSLIISPTTCSS